MQPRWGREVFSHLLKLWLFSLRQVLLLLIAEDLGQFLRGNDLQLIVCTVAWLLVFAPPSKLSDVAEAAALHMIVSDFDYQLRTQWLPRQILALAPSTLGARSSVRDGLFRVVFGPLLPGMIDQCVSAIRREKLNQIATNLICKA